MKKLLLILLCLPFIGFGQNVNIPDANFKAYLVGNTAINTNGDTEIQVSEASVFGGTIVCSNMNIADLTGIEAFTALTELYCGENNLTSLDISQNTALTTLYCGENNLTSLDVSNNTALTTLRCNWNQLTSLDVSNLTVLVSLYVGPNQFITNLDVSANTALDFLHAPSMNLTHIDMSNNTDLEIVNLSLNNLTCLDISNNTLEEIFIEDNNLLQLNLKNGQETYVHGMGNDSLLCVEVDDPAFAASPFTCYYFDIGTTFSLNCGYINPCWSTTSIQEHTTTKQLLKVIDLLGRETKHTNQPLFYIYDDGTVEKRIVIE